MTDQTPAPASTNAQGAPASLEDARASIAALRSEIAKVIVGQEDVVEQMLLCIMCRAHGLVVGVPGLAKTLLISTIAKSLGLQFSRVQFTPDLMPSDVTGTEVIQEDRTTGHRVMRFVHGPIFANVVLADEINRTPPKTQAALLEAMQERQVSVGGVQHPLPSPFFVLATQNPLEQEGTYPLPEAQLDRFMLQILIRYPNAEDELEIVRRSTGSGTAEVDEVLDHARIFALQQLVRAVPAPEHVMRYALRLVRCTRVNEPADAGVDRPSMVGEYVSWGAGPRASEFLILAAKARAVLRGEDHATIEHVKSVAAPVFRHRLQLNFNAEADGVTVDAIVDQLLASVPEQGGSASERATLEGTVADG